MPPTPRSCCAGTPAFTAGEAHRRRFDCPSTLVGRTHPAHRTVRRPSVRSFAAGSSRCPPPLATCLFGVSSNTLSRRQRELRDVPLTHERRAKTQAPEKAAVFTTACACVCAGRLALSLSLTTASVEGAAPRAFEQPVCSCSVGLCLRASCSVAGLPWSRPRGAPPEGPQPSAGGMPATVGKVCSHSRRNKHPRALAPGLGRRLGL